MFTEPSVSAASQTPLSLSEPQPGYEFAPVIEVVLRQITSRDSADRKLLRRLKALISDSTECDLSPFRLVESQPMCNFHGYRAPQPTRSQSRAGAISIARIEISS